MNLLLMVIRSPALVLTIITNNFWIQTEIYIGNKSLKLLHKYLIRFYLDRIVLIDCVYFLMNWYTLDMKILDSKYYFNFEKIAP